MANVLVRDVPPNVHAELTRRAEQAGQSLQNYLLTELVRLTERPTLGDVLDRVETRSGGRVGLHAAVEDLTEARDAR